MPISVRLKLIRQWLFATVGYKGHVPVRCVTEGENVYIQIPDRRISVPSVLRWKLYKKGWRARLCSLANEYGVGRHFDLTPGGVVIDIGANTGEFAIFAAETAGIVHCFEPDPNAFRSLSENTAAYDNIIVHPHAIWNEDTKLSLGVESDRADTSAFSNAAERVLVTATTLKTFMQANNIDCIDVIKCEAEGAEPEVLEGIGDASPQIRVLTIDTGAERNGKETNHECENILKEFGFTSVITEIVDNRQMTYGLRSAA